MPAKVRKFMIPANFIILDMEENPKIFILFNRPFLVTAGVVIDMKKGKISLEVNNESIEFDVFNGHGAAMIRTWRSVKSIGISTMESRKRDARFCSSIRR